MSQQRLRKNTSNVDSPQEDSSLEGFPDFLGEESIPVRENVPCFSNRIVARMPDLEEAPVMPVTTVTSIMEPTGRRPRFAARMLRVGGDYVRSCGGGIIRSTAAIRQIMVQNGRAFGIALAVLILLGFFWIAFGKKNVPTAPGEIAYKVEPEKGNAEKAPAAKQETPTSGPEKPEGKKEETRKERSDPPAAVKPAVEKAKPVEKKVEKKKEKPAPKPAPTPAPTPDVQQNVKPDPKPEAVSQPAIKKELVAETTVEAADSPWARKTDSNYFPWGMASTASVAPVSAQDVVSGVVSPGVTKDKNGESGPTTVPAMSEPLVATQEPANTPPLPEYVNTAPMGFAGYVPSTSPVLPNPPAQQPYLPTPIAEGAVLMGNIPQIAMRQESSHVPVAENPVPQYPSPSYPSPSYPSPSYPGPAYPGPQDAHPNGFHTSIPANQANQAYRTSQANQAYQANLADNGLVPLAPPAQQRIVATESPQTFRGNPVPQVSPYPPHPGRQPFQGPGAYQGAGGIPNERAAYPQGNVPSHQGYVLPQGVIQPNNGVVPQANVPMPQVQQQMQQQIQQQMQQQIQGRGPAGIATQPAGFYH